MAPPTNAKELHGACSVAPGKAKLGWRGLSPQAVGVLLVLLATVLWSTNGLFIKVLSIEALPLTGLRCAMAGVLLAPWMRSLKFRLEGDLAILIIFYTVMSLSFVTATKWTAAANAIVLQSTSPVWVFLVACLLARRVYWRYTVSIGIIVLGLAIIMAEPAHGTSFLGNLLGLAAGISFAGVNIYYARVRRPAVEVMVLINVVAALVIFAVQPGAFRFAEYSALEWLSLAYLGGIQIGLAHMCFFAALKRISTTQAAVLSLVEPLLNPIWVYLAIGELPSAYGFIGGGLVLSGIAVDALLRRNGRGAAAARP
ncbi:MAG: EamA family transporter [SAR324 cluster bacterium]|nr:EamA family transporter [SAR324 cluster bacterium]